jgi:uncharacterized protein YcbX
MVSTLGRPLNPTFGYGLSAVRTLYRLSVTPVKALRLSHPHESELTTAGIPSDRRFFLIDGEGNLFDATDHGPLLRIVPAYDPVAEHLRLTLPTGAVAEGIADDLGERIATDFFGHTVESHVVEGPFAEALSDFVGRPVRLARADRDGDGQDVYPLTVVSSASVRDLGVRGKSEGELDARRFRINLEIEGCQPYEEESWDGSLVRVGGATIRVRGQIPRCVVTTLGPESGEKDFRTLTEIARYRPRIGGRGGLPFGMYAEVEVPGRVRVGDPVEPISSRPAETGSVSGR